MGEITKIPYYQVQEYPPKSFRLCSKDCGYFFKYSKRSEFTCPDCKKGLTKSIPSIPKKYSIRKHLHPYTPPSGYLNFTNEDKLKFRNLKYISVVKNDISVRRTISFKSQGSKKRIPTTINIRFSAKILPIDILESVVLETAKILDSTILESLKDVEKITSKLKSKRDSLILNQEGETYAGKFKEYKFHVNEARKKTSKPKPSTYK